MHDFSGSTGVADAAKQFGFVNACGGKSVADLPHDLPLFIARAGQDRMPGLNPALDDFVLNALGITFRSRCREDSRDRGRIRNPFFDSRPENADESAVNYSGPSSHDLVLPTLLALLDVEREPENLVRL